MRAWWLATLLSLVVIPAVADVKKGIEAYEQTNFADALQEFRPLAEAGQPEAQYYLGMLYGNGEGVHQNDAQAAKWYKKAADQGLQPAQHNLGLLYILGQGVPQDYTQAYLWLSLAAAQKSGDWTASARMRDLVAVHFAPAQLASAQRRLQEWRPQAQATANVDTIADINIRKTAAEMR